MEIKKILQPVGVFLISLLILCSLTLAVSATPGTNELHIPLTPVTMGSLDPVYTDTGKISLSVNGMGTLSDTGIIKINKPAGATVKKVFLASATTGFFYSSTHLQDGDITINGQPVTGMLETPSNIASFNYWADVTSIVKPIVDTAAAGDIDLTIGEKNTAATDGEVLAVVFDDPNQATDNTVVLLFGAQAVNGDTFHVTFAKPIDLTDPNFAATMGLGISFSYQQNGAQQYSIVKVNNKPLTSSAGGEDDGDHANGALLTVGGLGDSSDNPANPTALPTNPLSDDELYTLKPFLANGDTQVDVFSQNPSNDDNIFFGYFDLKSVKASVNNSIPEFPTVAIPVAAILGLVFVFGRRKE